MHRCSSRPPTRPSPSITCSGSCGRPTRFWRGPSTSSSTSCLPVCACVRWRSTSARCSHVRERRDHAGHRSLPGLRRGPSRLHVVPRGPAPGSLHRLRPRHVLGWSARTSPVPTSGPIATGARSPGSSRSGRTQGRRCWCWRATVKSRRRPAGSWKRFGRRWPIPTRWATGTRGARFATVLVVSGLSTAADPHRVSRPRPRVAVAGGRAARRPGAGRQPGRASDGPALAGLDSAGTMALHPKDPAPAAAEERIPSACGCAT